MSSSNHVLYADQDHLNGATGVRHGSETVVKLLMVV